MRHGQDPAPYAHSRNHWWYTWIPVFGSFIWASMLLAMLITWLAMGRPQYVTQQGKIAYISDIGASFLQPLFIVGCCITAVSFFASLSIERWLRHDGRLLPNMRRRERVFAGISIFGAFVAAVGLILLSIFNTGAHRTLHRLFLAIFMVGVIISAVFTIVEYRWLSKEFGEARKLRLSYIAKTVIALILIALAVAFGITLYKAQDVGAVLEWVIAFGFTFYFLTFYFDLRLSKGVASGELGRERLVNHTSTWRGSGARRALANAPEMGVANTGARSGAIGRAV